MAIKQKNTHKKEHNKSIEKYIVWIQRWRKGQCWRCQESLCRMALLLGLKLTVGRPMIEDALIGWRTI